MDVFAPGSLSGVGLGNITSVAGFGGLLAMAVVSGALLAEGVVGTVLWLVVSIAGLATLTPAYGGAAPLMLGAVVAVFALGIVAWRLERSEAPSGRLFAFAAAVAAGACMGFAWSEWNELPFRLRDAEALVGTMVGLAAAVVGGHAAYLFTRGSVRAGGSAAIVGAAVGFVALVAGALGVLVPFAGYVVLALAAVLAIRLGRRVRAKYKGLRILA